MKKVMKMNNIENIPPVIYEGFKNQECSFKTMITNVLKKGKIKDKYLTLLTDSKVKSPVCGGKEVPSMDIYKQAFTAASANPKWNYEAFEMMGDATANKFMVWYTYRRFPQLFCPMGVKVVARVKINYTSREQFFKIADSLGFWPFIAADEEERSRKKKDLLEDALEAFVGATEYILDQKTVVGVGNAIVYDILSGIYNDIPISLKYEDLYDSKTRLKELFDFKKSENIGKLKYEKSPPRSEEGIVTTQVFRIFDSGQTQVIGTGSASRKPDAEKKAASNALIFLKNKYGLVKEAPKEYRAFNSF
jgi:dsRNA-specific ribonuclease